MPPLPIRLPSPQSYPPLPITIDAGTTTINSTTYVAVTIVLGAMDLRQTTITRPDEWEQSPFIPLLARTTILPHTIGTNSPTNNTGELYGYLMADDLLPTTWPAIILTDSQVAQTATLLLRDHADTITHRQAIRTELPAISLHLMARLNTVIQRLEDTDWSWHTEQADLVQAFHANTTQWIMAYSSLALDLCHTATAVPRYASKIGPPLQARN
eukprot:CAMPEP_0178640072 /NCGR_PEP_ID=MMETSP0698-20121128/15815_1 /TAXON_ID=265572 /ORGANISM="Extubocellulus spinifer, Strain CCMP396" /LENGTH=212 /DNA_ID=CAMNT_0020280475 /DNA_START=34 /DNA_END=672 /DNA_ORIENTATION=+